MEGSSNDHQMIGQFYTSARRFKQVMGSLPDGTPIPGGPYTYVQVGTMVVSIIFGWITRGIWGTDSTIGDLLILVIFSAGISFLLGKLPSSRRSPIKLLASVLVLALHPGPGGNWKGRPLRLSRAAQQTQLSVKKSQAKSSKINEAPQDVVDQPLEQAPVPSIEFGSSLNRLLRDNGLLNSERKK